MASFPEQESRDQRPKPSPTLLDLSLDETQERDAKVNALKAKRFVEWFLFPRKWPRPKKVRDARCDAVIWERKTQVARRDDFADPRMEAGKLRNLGIAAQAFNNVEITPERPLSFWRTLGSITKEKGYLPGMELKGGCIVPSLGGGVCLISNLLFQMAAELDWQILERHGHTMEAVPASSDQVWGLDATVFFPYVDLRIAPKDGPAVIKMRVEDGHLLIQVTSSFQIRHKVSLTSVQEAEKRNGSHVRSNAIRRRVFDPKTGRTLNDEIIALNKKKILHHQDLGRNCYNCNQTDCHSRPADIDLE